MARARYLKPGFFQNEGLAEVHPPDEATRTPASTFAARLCYEGLWVVADRKGRLEDRPKRLKVEIFPYDDVDVDALLTALAAHGFIERYIGADGKPYIAVPTFPKHQHPHVREPESTIPAPPVSKNGKTRSSTGRAPVEQRASRIPAGRSRSRSRSLSTESES